MTSGEVVFWLPEPGAPGDLLAVAVEPFGRSKEEIADRRFVYFDTFDWRLYRAGWRLRAEREGNGWRLDLDGWHAAKGRGTEVRPQSMDRTPAWVDDLAEGPLRTILEPIVEMRRLLPIARLERRSRCVGILDTEAKTRARVRIEEMVVRAGDKSRARFPLPTRIRVIPLKGYEKTARWIVRRLESGGGIESGGGTTLERGLAAIGRSPGDYSSKLEINLQPSLPAALAMGRVYGRLLEVMRLNEAGVRADIDSEFLHDFRVAVRRTRAGLGQLKGCLAAAEVAPFRSEFSWLGGITGPTRDLDVYLLKMPAYRATLPPSAAAALEPLAVYLGERQREAQRLLTRRLQSDRYRILVVRWAALLERVAAGEAAGREGLEPIRAVASRRIWRTYRRVLRRGGAIDTDSPAASIHRLRIDCKKLRYLMEFFRSLYPHGEISASIKALKKLQDSLGNFNDYEVQQASLMGFSEQMVAGDLAPVSTLMAMGRLVERLERGQQQERDRFHERFDRFAAARNRNHFQRLFKPSKRKDGSR